MKSYTPRSFTFDVIVRETADGRVTRTSKDGPWLRLATKMAKAGKVRLTCEGKGFYGYGRSYDVGYTCVSYTVTEIA
jgi:hypothetical protein